MNTIKKRVNPNKNNSKILKSQPPRNSEWVEDYKSIKSMALLPATKAFFTRTAKLLRDWSQKPDNLTLISFCRELGVTKVTFYEWRQKYPEIDEAHTFAMEQFADKREKGGLTRKYDPTFAWNSLARYDDEWKDYMEWKAKMTQEGKPKDITIRLEDIVNAQSNKDPQV